MSLELHSIMPFGKNKGKTVEEIFKEDSGYLVWLRQQRKDANSEPSFFSLEVSTLLDMEIKGSVSLRKKFVPFNLPIVERVVNTDAPIERAPEKEVSYTAWGEF
jgi:uncharacterized protein (DUF3820 family)